MADKSAVRRYWRRGIIGTFVGSLSALALALSGFLVTDLIKTYHQRDKSEEAAYEKLMKSGKDSCVKQVDAQKKIKPDTPEHYRAFRICFKKFQDAEEPKPEARSTFYYVMGAIGATIAAGLAYAARMILKGIAYTHLAIRKGNPTRRLSAVRIHNTHRLDEKLLQAGVVLKNSPNAIAEITLAKGATVATEPGTLAAMDSGIDIRMRVIDKGSVSSIFGRLLTGETFSSVRYSNTGAEQAQVVLHPKNSRSVVGVPLEAGEGFYCVEDSYFGAVGNVTVGFEFMKSPSLSRFAGLLAMQRLTAVGAEAGVALISAKGTVQEKQLAAGETLHLPKGRLVAAAGDISLGLWEQPTRAGRMLSGSGPFLTTVIGPGCVWYQVPSNVSSLGVIGGLTKRVVDILVPG